MNYKILKEKLKRPLIPGRKRAVLISTGSFCPVHRGHLNNIDIAAKFLSEMHKIDTLVAYISPSCDSYVFNKLGNDYIPFNHRFEMIQLACQSHNKHDNAVQIIPDNWEGSQSYFVPFPEVLKHFQKVIHKNFPRENLLVLYVSGADHFNRCELYRKKCYVGISRVGYKINGKTCEHRNIYICKDKRYEKYFSDTSSTAMRQAKEKGEPIDKFTYYSVVKYLQNVIHWI